MVGKLLKISDYEAENCAQFGFISLAGFQIRLVFCESEFVVRKRMFIKNIYYLWNNEFLEKKKDGYDFTIFIKDVEDSIDDKEVKEMRWWWDESGNEISTGFFFGTDNLQVIMKGLVVKWVYENGGFIFHAASSYKDDQLLAFSAVSGGGKSTTNKMMENEDYGHFSDDFLIVMRKSGGWEYWSTPFVEKLYLPASKSMAHAKIFFIEKNKPTNLVKLDSVGGVLKRLMGQVFRLEGFDQKIVDELVMDFAMENEFYVLERNLDTRKLKRVLDEN